MTKNDGWVKTIESGDTFEAIWPFPLEVSDGGRWRLTERRGTIEFGDATLLHKGTMVRTLGDKNEMYIVERKYRNKVWVRWLEKL